MRRALLTTICACLLGAFFPAPAGAAFGLKDIDVSFLDSKGENLSQAGAHPEVMRVSFAANTKEEPLLGFDIPDGQIEDLIVSLPPGFVGAPNATPHCTIVDFLDISGSSNACPAHTALGTTTIAIIGPPMEETIPVYNLEPPPGVAAKLGFPVHGLPITFEAGVNPDPPHNLVSTTTGIPQVVPFYAAELNLQGSIGGKPFLTLPRACQGPLETTFEAFSYQGSVFKDSVLTHDDAGEPLGFTGCGKLGLAPQITAAPTTDRADSPSGLAFTLDLEDEGLRNPEGIADSDIKKAVVTLPKGVTINPSVGEGLAICTPDQLSRETAFSEAGEGCPNASKLGTLHVESPLVDQPIDGSIYLAQQDDPKTSKPGAENPFDTLIALYFVLQNRDLGVSIKEPVKIEPDPLTGQLVATLDDNAQLPFSRFEANLRTGARAALVTPNACGTYTTVAEFYPWANPSVPVPASASFQINAGVKGAPCPSGGVPPYGPGFEAGAENNAAGAHSPFLMRLTREDGEQDMTKFSAILPPGQVGSLVGVQKCPDNAVAVAESKTGREELANPSCPAGSEIGDTLAGAGVGEALTYVGGKIYLAGPYKGRPLSVIAITPAVAGPFDAGTVAIRLALTLNPKTAEVEVDGAASDPIPHILQGIVLKVRDIRVNVNRPNFLVNPTSCAEESTRATIFGSFLNVFDPADDVPVGLRSRYQAADCASLPFKPRLGLRLKGGTKRGGHPGLTATYRPRKGDANLEDLVTRLPRSAFLDQAHIRTICTRVQFAADNCPEGAQYGYIRAFTPLLEEPLQGPVWLRSSNHNLPDLVFDLHGLVDVEVATRIDSQRGGIRARVESAPDAALSRVVLQMQGGKKGLIINSRNLCGRKSRATLGFEGHNGKRASANPVMRADCGGKGKAKR